MASRVLYFGTNDFNRSLVLLRVGYDVDRCQSLPEFQSVLQEKADAAAVMLGEEPSPVRERIVAVTRKHSNARLILFGTTYMEADEREFDLVIPPLMHPEQWLQKLAEVVEQSRALHDRSTAIRQQSRLLRRDSEVVRLRSMIERGKAVELRARAKRVMDRIEQNPEPSDNGGSE